MGLITKEVDIKINGNNFQWYKNHGYNMEIEKVPRKNSKKTYERYKSPINVKVEDLPPNSTVTVEVQCDHCGKIKTMKYKDYRVRVEKQGDYYCKDCWKYRIAETNIERYGFSVASQNPEISKKISVAAKSKSRKEKDVILQKKIETSRKHFGTDYPSQSEEVKGRVKATMIERYNVEYGMQSPIIQERARQGMIEKYGAPYSTQVPEIRKKIADTACQNQSVRTSKAQKYLADLYGGKLNGVVGYYNVDILLEDDKIVCEYDGKGHDLRVTLNYCSQEEFDKHEIIRDKTIKKEGYKIFRIIAEKDRLPSDDILLQMLDIAKQYFKDYPEHSWIEFNIEHSIYRNAEHKDGVLFNYGNLRRIKSVA